VNEASLKPPPIEKGNPTWGQDLSEATSHQLLAETYRAQAAQLSDPKERAELLLLAGRTIEGKLSQPLEALAVYREAAAIAPDYLPAIEAFADAAYRNQDWHRARELYDRLWQTNA